MRFAFLNTKSFIGVGVASSCLSLGILGYSVAAEPDIARYIDHTLLAANATKDKLKKLCDEAKTYGFRTVCVNACNVRYCVQQLKGSNVDVCAVVGFPLGATLSSVKAIEASQCIAMGAAEIDMVINVGALLDDRLDVVRRDIEMVRAATEGKVLKVILETCLLTPEQIETACKIAAKAGADFVKTSTGFSTGGAKIEDVVLMRKSVPASVQVKASGGIRNAEQAKAMIEAGATRLGASSGVSIVTGGHTAASKY